MIVIVADKIYVVGKKINYIYMDENIHQIKKNGKTADLMCYTVTINFEPQETQQQSQSSYTSRNNDSMTVDFKVYGLKRAISIFRDMVSQIREQCPDQLYLDKLLDNLLARSPEDDPSDEEVYRTRKTKRKDKIVLRGVKGFAE